MAHNPAVVWYRTVVTSNQQLEDTAQLFLGQRIQCARCHHHPYEKWSQQDYYGFSAFFSQVGRKNSLELRADEPRVFHQRGEARATDPRTGESLRPTGLGGEPMDRSGRRRSAAVAGRLDGRSAKNPYFARSLVNRYWKHFFSRGTGRAGRRHAGDQSGHQPRVARPPGAVVRRQPFRSQAIDPHDLPIADLSTQCRAERTERVRHAEFLPLLSQAAGGRSAVRRAAPGDRHDDQFCQHAGRDAGGATAGQRQRKLLSVGLRQADRIKAPANANDRARRRWPRRCTCSIARGAGEAFRPAAAAGAVCRRHLAAATSDKVEESVLDRAGPAPSAEERQLAVDVSGPAASTQANKQPAYEDIIWALLNTKEFLFNH